MDNETTTTIDLPTADELDSGAWSESESELRGRRNADGWHVVDPTGGIWWPGEAARIEIEAATDPAVTAVKICRDRPMDGRWAS